MTELPPNVAFLWANAGAPRRGPQPRLTREGLAAAALELAGQEGLRAVTMARVAESLGVTPMALYRHVPGKAELLALIVDAALGTPDPLPEGPWRAQVAAWMRAQLAVLGRHPWIAEAMGELPLGPNRLRWMEQGLQALAGTGMPEEEKAFALGTLSVYVLGEAQALRSGEPGDAATSGRGAKSFDWAGALGQLVDRDAHPALHRALAAGAFGEPGATPAPQDEEGEEGQEQDAAITILLDGIEALARSVRSGG